MNKRAALPLLAEFFIATTPLLLKKGTASCPVSPGERLMVTIHYLSSGASPKEIARDFRLGDSSVCVAISETLDAIWNVLSPTVFPHPNSTNWKHIADEF